MRDNQIQPEYVRKMKRKMKYKQNKEKSLLQYPDLINRKFNDIKTRFSVLYTDVTYLIWKGERYYQSTIIDGYIKEIVDVKWSKYNDNKLVMDNLNDAINKIKLIKKDLNGIIIHSDHGYQYTSTIYHDKCLSNGITISMGKNYHCADNIVIESFHSLLKKATIHNKIYNSHEEYIQDVIKWNTWYSNRKEKDIIKKIVNTFLLVLTKMGALYTGLIEYDKWLSYIQSACLLAVINWYLPKGVNDLTGSASFSQGGVAYSQTNDPEANENITRDVKNALKLAGEIIDIISSKTVSRPYNYSLDNYAHPWEEEYKHISKKTFYPTLLFWLKDRIVKDNSINISYPTKNDFSKIDYNEYIKLVVPFDNDTIYEENGVWKAKQSGEIPSDVIKDSDSNKNYIEKVDDKYIVKTSQDINTKQDKLVSGTNIKTINGSSLLGSGDISISGGNDWELINYPEANEKLTFKIPDYDLTKYYYKISISITDYASANKFVTHYFETISQKSIFSFLAANSYESITIKQDGSIKNETNNIVIKDLTIKRKLINNSELMSNEPHSIYNRDMDIDLPKYQEETSDSYDIVIRKINSATTINELNLFEKHPIWRIISNNRNDIKELFNKKWLELNKNE